METRCQPLDLATIGTLSFEPLDAARFPAPGLCRAAIVAGPAAPAVLNAANEIAVAAFLERRIGFLDIATIVASTLERYGPADPGSLDDVFAIDREARRVATELLEGLA